MGLGIAELSKRMVMRGTWSQRSLMGTLLFPTGEAEARQPRGLGPFRQPSSAPLSDFQLLLHKLGHPVTLGAWQHSGGLRLFPL